MLQVGKQAPPFSLPDASMEMMSLQSYRGKKNVVLYFYPRDGSPACTIQSIDFSDRENEFAKCDAVVFGVSRDDVISHATFRDQHGLTVQLLADTEAEVCRMYDVLEDKVVDGRSKTCLSNCTFIIDKQGIVRDVLRDVSPRKCCAEVLKVLKQMHGRAN
jgi:thioredoxin-dependent peroxiredoxin